MTDKAVTFNRRATFRVGGKTSIERVGDSVKQLVLLVAVFSLCLSGCTHRSRSTPKPAATQPPPRRVVYRRPPPPPVRNVPPTPPVYVQAPQQAAPPPPARAPMETWYPNGQRMSNRWATIVVHHSATDRGGAASFDKGHRSRGWEELGYHFVIGNGTDTPDGFIETGSRWHKQKHGAHCKTPSNYYNDHGIGICLVGDFTKTRPSRRQMESLEKLVRFLSYACRIPTDKVTTHCAVTGKTQCPGNLFSLAPIKRALQGPPMASSMGR